MRTASAVSLVASVPSTKHLELVGSHSRGGGDF